MTQQSAPRNQWRSTAIRFKPATHEALKETATELGVGVNWLVNKLCEEGLKAIDLSTFTLARTPLAAGVKEAHDGR